MPKSSESSENPRRTLAEELRFWEGEYCYPGGLMTKAAAYIELLESEIRIYEGVLRRIHEESERR